MDVWKTIFAPMIVGILMLVIGLWVGRLQAPELPGVSAEIRSVYFDNPIAFMEPKERQTILDLVRSAWDIKEIVDDRLSTVGASTTLKLVNLSITNNNKIRITKPLEVLADPRALLLTESAKDGKRTAVSRVLLNPLDPGSTVRVFILADNYFKPVTNSCTTTIVVLI